eukprot:g48693.t1
MECTKIHAKDNLQQGRDASLVCCKRALAAVVPIVLACFLPGFFCLLPQRLLSSRRASVPNGKQSAGKLEASQAVSAFYQLGKAVREAQPEQQQSVVARTRSSPAFASMMGELKLQLPALQGKDVSNTWLGVRDLRVSESRAPSDLQLLQELCKITKEQAVSLDAQAIANSLTCMAKLAYNPGEEVLRTLCAEALKKAKTFTAQGISNTLNACSKLDYNPGEKRNFERVREAQLQPGEEVLRTLCTEALKKAKTFDAQDIANTLNACSKLDCNPGEEVLRTLCTEALKKAKTFTAQGIANTSNACSKLDYNPGEEVLRTLGTEALKKANTFTAQGIANTLNACAKLNYNPGEEALRTLCTEALKKANTFNAQNIANTLNACAMLNYNSGEEVLRSLCAEALKKADTFKLDQQNIANTLHACMMLNHVHPAMFSRLLALLVQYRAGMDPKELDLEYYLVLPAALAAACKLSFLSNPAKSSKFHKEVTKRLRDAGITHVNEDTSSGLWVDIGLIEHKVVIEVDGPTHFVSGVRGCKRTLMYKPKKRRTMRLTGDLTCLLAWVEIWVCSGGRPGLSPTPFFFRTIGPSKLPRHLAAASASASTAQHCESLGSIPQLKSSLIFEPRFNFLSAFCISYFINTTSLHFIGSEALRLPTLLYVGLFLVKRNHLHGKKILYLPTFENISDDDNSLCDVSDNDVDDVYDRHAPAGEGTVLRPKKRSVNLKTLAYWLKVCRRQRDLHKCACSVRLKLTSSRQQINTSSKLPQDTRKANITQKEQLQKDLMKHFQSTS